MVGTVSSVRQPAASPITARSRERAAVSRPQAAEQPTRAAAQKVPDTRTVNGVPAWKRKVVDSLAGELERRGASRGSRVRERLTAENVDARITNLSQQLHARTQNRAGYVPPGAARTGMVVNRTA